jgi:predicted SnoaL-like aldol condensation-catalyzing enzyme
MDLHAFIVAYTDAVYHERNPDAASRFIADPCIRHEHGQRVVMTLEENQRRIAGFLDFARDVRFSYIQAIAEGEYYASAFEFSFEASGLEKTMSGIEIFRVQDGKITETWNAAAGEGPWG